MKHALFFGDAGRIGAVYSPEILEKLHAVLCFETDDVVTKRSLDEYRDILSRADYLFTTWGMPHFEREEIREYLPNLKAVFYGAGSVQHFAREFLEEGIAVFSAWAANGTPVAEYTFFISGFTARRTAVPGPTAAAISPATMRSGSASSARA